MCQSARAGDCSATGVLHCHCLIRLQFQFAVLHRSCPLLLNLLSLACKAERICRGWIQPVLSIRTEDIYLAAGLDAVVMLKTIEYGVQLFVPIAVVCLAVCTPRTATQIPYGSWHLTRPELRIQLTFDENRAGLQNSNSVWKRIKFLPCRH
jgi:hypothetical protein